jgi:hypothetical protein
MQEVLLGNSGRMHAAVNLFGTKNKQIVNRTTYVNAEAYVAGVLERRNLSNTMIGGHPKKSSTFRS